MHNRNQSMVNAKFSFKPLGLGLYVNLDKKCFKFFLLMFQSIRPTFIVNKAYQALHLDCKVKALFINPLSPWASRKTQTLLQGDFLFFFGLPTRQKNVV